MYYSASELQARSGQNLCPLSEFQSLTLYILGLLPYLSCSHRPESNKCAHLNETMESLPAVSISSTGLSEQSLQPDSASFCLMVKWDFTLTFRRRCFQHYLQNKMWLYRYLKEDNPRPHFINYDRVHVLKEASRIQYLHLKILFKDHFLSSQCWKTEFFFIM